MKKGNGIDDGCDNKNTIPGHQVDFIFSKSRRNMNNLIREINDFYNNDLDYTDTD